MDKFDLFFAPLGEGNYHGTNLFSFYYDNPIGIKGIRALIIRFFKVLFTPKGTDPTDLEYGTSFGNLIGGHVSSNANLLDIVAINIVDAVEQIKKQDLNSSYSDEERIAEVSITDFVMVQQGCIVFLRLRNVAGTTLDTVLPL